MLVGAEKIKKKKKVESDAAAEEAEEQHNREELEPKRGAASVALIRTLDFSDNNPQ